MGTWLWFCTVWKPYNAHRLTCKGNWPYDRSKWCDGCKENPCNNQERMVE